MIPTDVFHFVPFTVIGDPDYEKSLQVVRDYVAGGATMLELGFAFSDPVADGPVIQAADQRALAAGITTEKNFQFIEAVREFTDIPIGLLLYYNLVFKYGVEEFFARAKKAGVTTILIADLPPNSPHGQKALELAKQYDLQAVFMVSELTSDERLQSIIEATTGFLYLVSTPGVTGARKDLADSLDQTIQRIKSQTDLPVLVGFGISERAHVEAVRAAGADGAIVGSRLVKEIEAGKLTQIQNVLGELRLS